MNQGNAITPKQNRNLLIYTGALLILLIASTVIFGFYVLAITAVSYGAAIAVEVLFAKARKRSIDVSWYVSPLVFALLMTPTIPLWIVAVGSAFGVFFGKAVFGGYGKNVFNPAIVGLLFILISFPAFTAVSWFDPNLGWYTPGIDAVAAATPLIVFNRGGEIPYTLWQMLNGMMPGTIGETFRLGILLLGILLLVLKVADWRIPLFYLATVFGLNALGQLFGLTGFKDPIMSLLLGGLLFGAFFVATDPVTAPMKPLAKILYGIGLGFFTVVIRNFATFPEGVTFSIIIMNAIGPLLDTIGKEKGLSVEETEAVV
jgi:electron transport complex protein RnfD